MLRSILFAGAVLFIFVARSSEIASKGVLDLTDTYLEESSIALDGEWEFFWNELFDPNEIPAQSEYVNFPSLWNDLENDTTSFSGQGYATYRLKVLLSSPEKGYTLHVEDMYSAFSLFVNGELVLKNGKVAKSKSQYIPEWKPDFVAIHNLKDTNEFVLQIANFDHHKGGVSESIRIGGNSLMKAKQNRILAYDLILTGSLVMGGLFFLGLYFFGHHDRAILFFSIFCIVYAYRIIGFGYYALHHLVDIPWGVAIRFEYLSLFIGTYIFGKFVEKLYPDEVSPIFFKTLYALTFAFSAVVVVFPPSIFTRLVTPFFVLLAIYLPLVFVIYYKAFRKKLIGSEYAILSTGVVISIFIYNIFIYYGILPIWESTSFWGYLLFFFSQSLILSFRFAYFLKIEKARAEIASQAKSDFLSTISHEIRTPLNAVVGISHLLLMENPRKDQAENLTSLKFSAEHLTTLINDILDYNKLESGNVRFEEMDVQLSELGQRIHHSYQPNALEKGLVINFECDERLSNSHILDATRMSQILNNLIDNAIKFTHKGEVKLTFELVEENKNSQTILFKIKDSGIGIPEDKLDKIFERFTQASYSTTREYGGSGLGLSIVKKLLDLQGVEIKIKSTVDQGSEFYFSQTFKIGSAKTKTIEGHKSDTDFDLKGMELLLVEDNNMNVLVAGKFLDNWGVKYGVASNGKEAVGKAKENTYDLILMDLQMPVMDGYEAAEKIRIFDKSTPIVALTASALLHVQENVHSAGMNDFVTKPFDPKELKRKIYENLKP